MRPVIIITGLCLLFVLFRLFLFYSGILEPVSTEPVSFEATLRSDPKVSGSIQRFSVFTPQGFRVFITTSRFPTYHYGQRLRISGMREVVERGGGSLLSTMDYPEITVSHERANVLYGLAYSFRDRVVSVFERNLIYPYSGLLVGIVFGVREGIPDSLSEALVKTGVIHITAASGMNVTLVAGAMFFLFSKVLSRKAAILISVLAIWFYAAVAGFDASITRASIMATIAFSAAILGRQHAGWYALFLTGCIMVLINPSVIEDIGFGLSFASTAGILFLVPLFQARDQSSQDQSLWFLKDDLKTTVAAQLFTIPILLSAFGVVNPFSVIVNLFILWTIPFLMVFGGIASFAGLIFAPLSIPFLYMTLPLLWYITQVVLISSTYLPVLELERFPLSLSIAYYLILIAVCLVLYRRRANEKV